MGELKATLNLPKTDFSMKANLPQNEPKMLARWQEMKIYELVRQSRLGSPTYMLHDGPPYANGPIHLGTAFNKTLKDFAVKSKTMDGFDAPYVPGWDCHGLPIEIKVDESLGRKKLEMHPMQVRAECRKYAEKFLDLQRGQFKRIGVFGDWERPYSTMNPRYESVVVRTLYDFLEKGALYKGLKPVYWCIHDKTALAEAEVEYENHTSPSIWVKYRITSDPSSLDPALAGKQVSTIIWTTTPWTLPASMAVAFHPDLEYVALEHGADVYIVAAALAEQTKANCHLDDAKVIARFSGRTLEFTTFSHPFLERQILGVLADYVTTDQGTGAVHTAPSHGADDFYTGVKYKLDQACEVDEAGRIRHGLPEYDGLRVFDANPKIVELLKSRGVLLGYGQIEHSYPHCWRCHHPVIFRATEQWFISMEAEMGGGTLRQRALEEIKSVKWDPAWGEERIANMVSSRPDWCISRQRVWGVPIAVFFCECGQLLNDAAANHAVVELFAARGSDAWYTTDARDILPSGVKCAKCGGTSFRKEMDIIDVWFESGVSSLAVLPEKQWPADMYLEGGDQHRGWFQSSLLCSIGARNHIPYRTCVTPGWTLDPQGRAMSKSLGNVVDPVDIANRLGAEIVRLWVASVDFREDVRASEELMQRIADQYRKVRNTFRFPLGNLFDFDPARDALAFADLMPLDRYMLLRTADMADEVVKHYREFAFHKGYYAMHDFCVVALSAMYFDVLKDRLYTFAPNSRPRRSAQTAIWRIAEALVRLFAPVMSFTAEEIWGFLPRAEAREPSVHLARFPQAAQLTASSADPAEAARLRSDFEILLAVREEGLKALEVERKNKTIGTALEAVVTLTAPEPTHGVLEKYRDTLRELLITSGVNVERAEGDSATSVTVQVSRAPGQKCERCWNYSTHVGENREYPTVCERCSAALAEIAAAAQGRT